MNFINKINNYLIERYPTIWNTKIVWMLTINVIIHVLFYIIGYVSHRNPVSLQSNRVIEDYFSSGLILVHIILSMLLLVGWLVSMFKNNGFKNFYPTSTLKLFGQFACYLIIIFISITFYFSYMFGFRAYINKAYPNDELVKNVEIINKAYPFLSVDYQNYQLNRRAYPDVFKDLYCENSRDLIDYNQKYFKIRDEIYQFYSVYKVSVTEKDEYNEFKYPAKEYKNSTSLAYKRISGDTCTYYFKKEVMDVSSYIKTKELSYYNFSKVFYTLEFGTIDFYDRYYLYSNHYAEPASAYDGDIDKNTQLNKQLAEILDRKNPEEIKKILEDFLKVSKQFKIRNNLKTESWFKLVYHPDTFEVKKFISTDENRNNGIYPPEAYAAAAVDTLTTDAASATAAAAADENKNTTYNYYQRNLTDNFYEVNSLNDFLRNIELIKNVDFVSKNIHVYIWMAFIIATLIFSFRVTNLRAVIFTGIATGVLSLIIGLITLLYTMGVSHQEEYFAAYLVLIVATIILVIPVLFPRLGSKLFTAVLINMSMNGFVLYVFLILGIISMYQNDACSELRDKGYTNNCVTLLEKLDMNTSYVLLAAGLVFLFLYTIIVKKWRALPE